MSVDPKLLYWTWAWANMAVVVGLAFSGVREIRRHAIARHRRRMLTAAALVLVFLLSYVCKTALLGYEELELWEPTFVYVLRVHEVCIFTMLLAGGTAVYLARRLRLAAGAESNPGARGLRRHRRAGWTALISGTLGLLTSAYVLFGMYQRS